jgi:hypothetical protein
MYPLAMLLGVVLGSVLSIALGLGLVALVFWLLKSDYPRLEAEFMPLVASLGIFVALTVVAALSFYGELKRKPWRLPAQLLLLGALLATGWHYWPE